MVFPFFFDFHDFMRYNDLVNRMANRSRSPLDSFCNRRIHPFVPDIWVLLAVFCDFLISSEDVVHHQGDIFLRQLIKAASFG